MEELDVLQHLLEVEKSAAELVFSAQEEADRRVADSARRLRADWQARYEAASAELESETVKKREEAKAARDQELASYRKELSGRSVNIEQFNRLCEDFFFGAP